MVTHVVTAQAASGLVRRPEGCWSSRESQALTSLVSTRTRQQAPGAQPPSCRTAAGFGNRVSLLRPCAAIASRCGLCGRSACGLFLCPDLDRLGDSGHGGLLLTIRLPLRGVHVTRVLPCGCAWASPSSSLFRLGPRPLPHLPHPRPAHQQVPRSPALPPACTSVISQPARPPLLESPTTRES